jgi:hypothetical protein
MKCLADQKLKTRKKTLSAPPPSIYLVSFSAILWLPSLLLLRLALVRFARQGWDYVIDSKLVSTISLKR